MIKYKGKHSKYEMINILSCSCGYIGVVDHYHIVQDLPRFTILTVGCSYDYIECPKCSNKGISNAN